MTAAADWGNVAAEVRERIARGGGLVSRAGMARRWSRSRQRVWQYTKMDSFPAPVCASDGGDELWLWNQVDEWREVRLSEQEGKANGNSDRR